MNKKNRGFSIFVAIVASLILMGVSVGIITSINRSLEQVNNIARSNQFFFAAESGKEAALFHHNVRGAGLILNGNQGLSHGNIGADVVWDIDGRESGTLSGEIHENEKITIPLYWDSSANQENNITTHNMIPATRAGLELSFPDNPIFQDPIDNQVLLVWSVSRINSTDGVQAFIPIAPIPGEPCASGSSFYCKSDLCAGAGGACSGTNHFAGGIIDFSQTTDGMILPGEVVSDLNTFISDTNSSQYEISFQPVLPFIDTNDNKISNLNFKLTGTSEIPRNIYTITSSVDFGDFKKEIVSLYKEKPSIGAFDYVIFR